MAQPADATAEAIALLADRRSPKRRAGARRLRKLKDPKAGPALLEALRREVQDPRTWETQYHMIMALGESGYRPALPYLHALAQRSFDATMVYTALGDAIVRLGRSHENDPTPVLALMQVPNDMLADGAFRAAAMLRLQLDVEAIEKIVDRVSMLGPNDPLRFWVAAAAPGWSHPKVERFLQECARGPREDVRQAAVAALQKRYLRWNPL